ncbi:MAG: hypothetical protein K2W96_06560 [Gemmataceae bacterium]|nr:hypothetical protein [Gemmataceae bacterium]
MWGTFTPSHRPWLGAALGSGLRPGDPAALLDPATGEVDWLPVGPAELAQVGHIKQMQGDHAGAWRCYEQARAGAPAKAGEDFPFFESCCLSKLGRRDEAARKPERSRESFTPSAGTSWLGAERLEGLARRGSLSGELQRDLHQGEVLLVLPQPMQI